MRFFKVSHEVSYQAVVLVSHWVWSPAPASLGIRGEEQQLHPLAFLQALGASHVKGACDQLQLELAGRK